MTSLAIFSLDGLLYFLRWMHYFFGVISIGHLYYFNFVQGAFMAETDAPTKSQVLQKLLPRALWWFRWGAMFTMLSGITILSIRGHLQGFELFATGWGAQILIGVSLGLLMWGNVWFVIWPHQQVVMANAKATAEGKPANPAAATSAAKALLASRTNTLFSIPMLFFMGAGRHLPVAVEADAQFGMLAGLVGAILLGLEFNALKGKLGPLTTVRGVIHCGVALAVVLYGLVEFCL